MRSAVKLKLKMCEPISNFTILYQFTIKRMRESHVIIFIHFLNLVPFHFALSQICSSKSCTWFRKYSNIILVRTVGMMLRFKIDYRIIIWIGNWNVLAHLWIGRYLKYGNIFTKAKETMMLKWGIIERLGSNWMHN